METKKRADTGVNTGMGASMSSSRSAITGKPVTNNVGIIVECRFLLTPTRPVNLVEEVAQMRSDAKLVELQGSVARLESVDVFLQDGVGISFVIVARVDSWEDAQAQCDQVVIDLLGKIGFADVHTIDTRPRAGVEPINILGSVLTPA